MANVVLTTALVGAALVGGGMISDERSDWRVGAIISACSLTAAYLVAFYG